MTPLSDALPLSAYRDSLQRYLGSIAFSFDSVAGSIISARLARGYARDPLRPCLLLWSCAANGAEIADALPVAASFDLFDRFMLLHDELADEDAHAIAAWGLGQSLNAGDALYAVAFRSLASDVVNPARRLHAARVVAEAVLEAIERRDGAAGAQRALTGAALQAGATIGGAADVVALAFGRAGRALGMARAAGDAAAAGRFARESIESLRPYARPGDLDAFAEIALEIARRAA